MLLFRAWYLVNKVELVMALNIRHGLQFTKDLPLLKRSVCDCVSRLRFYTEVKCRGQASFFTNQGFL